MRARLFLASCCLAGLAFCSQPAYADSAYPHGRPALTGCKVTGAQAAMAFLCVRDLALPVSMVRLERKPQGLPVYQLRRSVNLSSLATLFDSRWQDFSLVTGVSHD